MASKTERRSRSRVVVVTAVIVTAILGVGSPTAFAAEEGEADAALTSQSVESTEAPAQAEAPPPADAAPAEEAPADPPADEPAAGEPIAEEPAEQPAAQPAEKQPAEEAPAEEAPVEGTPAGEAPPADSNSDDEPTQSSAPAARFSADALVVLAALADNCTAWPIGTPAGFEIDGNLCANPSSSTGTDWANTGSVADDGYNDSTGFTNGVSESDWPWPAGSTTSNGISPEANDIGNVYSYSVTSGGSVYAMLGFERAKTTGSIAYHVELNAKPNQFGPVPDRSEDDLRLTFDQQGSSTIALVSAETWDAAMQKWVSLNSLAGFVGRVNQGTTLNLDGTSLGKGQFAEVAVNLTSLFGPSGCSGQYGTLNLRSSASPSDSSQLKDWVAPRSFSVPSTCASVVVDKKWVIDGKTYAHGAQPFGSASLTLTGQTSPAFGATYAKRSNNVDYEVGDSVTIGEQVGSLPAGCTNVASGDIGAKTLASGLNRFTITNTVTCTYLTLKKEVVGGDALPGAWTLTADGTTPLSGAHGTAAVTKAHVASGTYTIGESGGPAGYEQTALVCDAASTGDQVTVAAGSHVTCTITNSALVGLTVTKSWVLDGQTYADGEQPVGEAHLTIDGMDAEFGTTYDDFVVGTSVAIAETVTALPERCEVETTIDGTEGTSATHVMTMTPSPNVVAVVNTVTCQQQLTLVKNVAFGAAPNTSWQLVATGAGGFSGVTGSDDVTARPVTAGATYTLAETGGPATYVQSGSWACVDDDTDTAVDAADEAVTVAYGQAVTCTVTNTTATLTLLKHIAEGAVDVLDPSDWTLTATPSCGIGALTVHDAPGAEAESADNTAEIRPGCDYVLAEQVADGSPIAYQQVSLEIWNTETEQWDAVEGDTIRVAAGTHATYRFVNDLVPAVGLPLTGGTGELSFLVIGLALLLLAAAVRWSMPLIRRAESR